MSSLRTHIRWRTAAHLAQGAVCGSLAAVCAWRIPSQPLPGQVFLAIGAVFWALSARNRVRRAARTWSVTRSPVFFLAVVAHEATHPHGRNPAVLVPDFHEEER